MSDQTPAAAGTPQPAEQDADAFDQHDVPAAPVVKGRAASVLDPDAKPILEVRDLRMYFPVKSSGIDPAHDRPRAGRRRHLLPGPDGRFVGPGGGVRAVASRPPGG